jgi:hypothetical protein
MLTCSRFLDASCLVLHSATRLSIRAHSCCGGVAWALECADANSRRCSTPSLYTAVFMLSGGSCICMACYGLNESALGLRQALQCCQLVHFMLTCLRGLDASRCCVLLHSYLVMDTHAVGVLHGHLKVQNSMRCSMPLCILPCSGCLVKLHMHGMPQSA